MAVDDDFSCFYGAEEVHFGAALDDDSVAFYVAVNFAGFANDEVSGAICSALNLTFDGEVVGVNGDAVDVAFLVNKDVAPGLDAGVFLVSDVVIFEANIRAAMRAERGGGVG